MTNDLVCLSHLRWDFVYQRPNHLMARAARDRQVLFVEEPVVEPGATVGWRLADHDGVCVATPVLPELDEPATEAAMAENLRALLDRRGVVRPVAWFYTPMALPWARPLVAGAAAVVYDSMDYLAGFRGAPPRLLELEDELLRLADLVFAGGARLHGRLRRRHPEAHCFPSSVDVAHFATARLALADPPDQAPIGRPRVGYAGVIDERLDLELVGGVADARPDVDIVFVGPVAKIDSADIPSRPNIHRLGRKAYAELPSYLAGWDVGWMPFARNEATRYISPTKTPEYLAAGLPVISTSIHDVVEPYGRLGFVTIADDVASVVSAIDAVTAGDRAPQEQVDAFLAAASWDVTWAAMDALIADAVRRHGRRRVAAVRTAPPVPVPAARRPVTPARGPLASPVLRAHRATSRTS